MEQKHLYVDNDLAKIVSFENFEIFTLCLARKLAQTFLCLNFT